ncbi:hypothetical protein ACFLWA_06595 [Chloroflexota bacterium]
MLLYGATLLSITSCAAVISGMDGQSNAIPNGLFYPLVPDDEKLIRYQPPDYSQPIPHVPIAQHPFMAGNAGNNMHNDALMSDAYAASGPLGLIPEVSSRSQGFGGYGTVAFDQAERLVGVYSNGRSFQLELMDPFTLEELASFDLPPRPRDWLLQGVLPWEYLGAGMYFYLDEQDRAVVPTTEHTIQVIQIPELGSEAEFELVREYDLTGHVVPMRWPKTDSVAWLLPDWSGGYYWYATTGGMVGTVNVDTAQVRTKRLEGEVIENSFALGEDGVFILSDQALYRFSQDGDGEIITDWRTNYDRGPGKKPGHITRGSGTSVTLVGGPEGWVIIADNAEPRINLLFIRRADGAVACSTPLFAEGKSGTDISTVGFEHADEQGAGIGQYSVLIENNWGHHSFPRSQPEAGLSRVDLVDAGDGATHCEEVWTSQEKGIGVFKLSLGNGLAYMYWRSEQGPGTRWYFTAVDFATGETVYKKLTGTGLGYNNWAGALFLHPDGGLAYSTTLFGLVAVRDSAR